VGYILAAALIDNLNKKREEEKDIILAVFLRLRGNGSYNISVN
jgi:hypothetical protein